MLQLYIDQAYISWSVPLQNYRLFFPPTEPQRFRNRQDQGFSNSVTPELLHCLLFVSKTLRTPGLVRQTYSQMRYYMKMNFLWSPKVNKLQFFLSTYVGDINKIKGKFQCPKLRARNTFISLKRYCFVQVHYWGTIRENSAINPADTGADQKTV